MKHIFSLLLCLILILNIAMPIIGESVVNVPEETVDILVWAKDIACGERIVEDSLKIVRVLKENTPSNVIEDEALLYTRYATRDLYEGEYASEDQVSDTDVRAHVELLKKPIETSEDKYVIVTDYVVTNTGDDLAELLQEIIDKNPNRTIYFPDGVYTIASPIFTSADGVDSVSLRLSDGAIIKASDDWKNRGGSAMICLGGSKPKNNITDIGSYYCLVGGTIDGNGKANGVNIVSGRESMVRELCIRNVIKGIIVERGANGGSSDIDFEDITIIGNGLPGSVGIDNNGWDNTYTNIRIYDMEKGATALNGEVASIYIINTEKSYDNRLNTVGIDGPSRISNCVTVNCATAFKLSSSTIIFDCTSIWTSSEYTKQTMSYISQRKTVLDGCKAYFAKGEGVSANFFEVANETLIPIVEGCFVE